ncbi:MAG: hydrogenase maturation nickel metallochaperone HypA [Candidatus Binatia bacterium]
MHELSLIGAVLRMVEEQAVAERFQNVINVCLDVGELSNVEIEALVFCFGIVKRGSLAHNARLSIQTIPGEAWCGNCRKRVHIALRTEPCPCCGTWGLSVIGGDQITVKELEVE